MYLRPKVLSLLKFHNKMTSVLKLGSLNLDLGVKSLIACKKLEKRVASVKIVIWSGLFVGMKVDLLLSAVISVYLANAYKQFCTVITGLGQCWPRTFS